MLVTDIPYNVAMGPTLLQSLEEKDKKNFLLGLKYMYYNVHCTFIGMYISDFLKILSKMFCSVL